MKTHGWLLPAVRQEQAVSVKGTGTLRINPLGQTARGVLILALALSGIGAAGAAVTTGHGTGEHARAYHAAGNAQIKPIAHRAGLGLRSHYPWMY